MCQTQLESQGQSLDFDVRLSRPLNYFGSIFRRENREKLQRAKYRDKKCQWVTNKKPISGRCLVTSFQLNNTF